MSFSAEDYKKPQWQERRLEALNAAGFQCEHCGEDEKQLHVHHINYADNKRLWEYDESELLVLCTECHDRFHTIDRKFRALLGALMKLAINGETPIERLVDFISGQVSENQYSATATLIMLQSFTDVHVTMVNKEMP